ncbi:MAG TPA: hypothetical protein VFN61_13405 [Acidimicrobiales bacterium]|nr:hypothetical protein [Acidimicrobiales bacterium]
MFTRTKLLAAVMLGVLPLISHSVATSPVPRAGVWALAPGLPAPDLGPAALTCTSSTFCLATDAYVRTPAGWAPPNGLIGEVWRGHRWYPTNSVPLHGPGAAPVTFLGCITDTDCVGMTSGAYSSHWDGSTWSPFSHVEKSSMANIYAFSCNTHFCLAEDGSTGAALVFNGRAWSEPAAISKVLDNYAGALSCPRLAAECVLTSSTGNTAVVDRGAVVKKAHLTGEFMAGETYAFSCGSPSSCFIGGYVKGKASYWTWDGQRWSAPQPEIIGGIRPYTPGVVSCANTTFCGMFTIPQGWSVFDGRKWPTDRLDPKFVATSVNALSCPAPDFCMAIAVRDRVTGIWTWRD